MDQETKMKLAKMLLCDEGDTCENDSYEYVLVWTEHRGVIWGKTKDPMADPITIKDARMCLYWDKKTGGVFGLCDKGPNSDCRISATLPEAKFKNITGVAKLSDEANKAWHDAPVQGRD